MKKRVILLGTLLFIGINLILVYIDEEGRIDRISYIKEWSVSYKEDVSETLYTTGVFASESEEQVYFDEKLGSFQEFLVQEGDIISSGDGLYTYRVHNYNEMENKLLSEIEKINQDILSIEMAITEMEMTDISSLSSNSNPLSNFNITEDEIEIEVELPESSNEAEMMKRQYLVEKEKELSQKYAELTYAETQLDELQTTGDTITVNSPYDGMVKTVDKSLEAPLITIVKTDLHVLGELTEDERKEVVEGLPVEVRLQGADAVIEGEVFNVGQSPESIEVNRESIYPFSVGLMEEEDVDGIIQGYHADLAITLEESLGATVLPESVVFTDSIWKMTEDGKLSNLLVDTGLKMDGVIEINSGVIPGDWAAKESIRQFRNDATFITPLKINQLTRDSVALDESNWRRYFVIGFISR
ncbi:HlyD family efflux transporter periplasmic adaptor subunit [Oceanobacillus salinisoli]|uniref:HlyD family efflux transporter periplasmic adaptor subunit n=1 Tax=Oceanobacillus salinisoli TaxID=2678611 RepID=UPI001E2D0AFB|nr:efflux RND transporter periplasmic adaptor subunit [Oceanobacillus salinisoli]